VRRSTILMIGCVASIAVMLFPPLDVAENSNLTVRMIEDILIFVYAIIFGYVLDRYATVKIGTRSISSLSEKAFDLIRRINKSTRGLFFALLIPTILLVYWTYPINFDATALNIYLRYAADLSYVVSAILAGMALVYIPRKFRVLLLYFMFMSVGMMGSMMLVWIPGFYTVYSPVQNTDMNTFMMMFGAFGIIGTSSYLLKVMDVI
jgi:hypothetical protein